MHYLNEESIAKDRLTNVHDQLCSFQSGHEQLVEPMAEPLAVRMIPKILLDFENQVEAMSANSQISAQLDGFTNVWSQWQSQAERCTTQSC